MAKNTTATVAAPAPAKGGKQKQDKPVAPAKNGKATKTKTATESVSRAKVGDLTPTEHKILTALLQGSRSKQELGATASVMGAFSRDGLGSQGGGLGGKGYVKRAPAEEGQRGISYTITAEGRKALERANKAAASEE